jgi:hypothetical protein
MSLSRATKSLIASLKLQECVLPRKRKIRGSGRGWIQESQSGVEAQSRDRGRGQGSRGRDRGRESEAEK